MTNFRRVFQFLMLLSVGYAFMNSTSVLAHVRWGIDSITPPRTNDTGLKAIPCGNASRTSQPTILSAGQTIDVTFEETINHPGHYRIAFSPAYDENFDSYILVDDIPDTTNRGVYTQQITLPMEMCAECTLQLIQVMTTNPNPLPGDFYYSCSDIQLTNSGDITAPMPISNLLPLQQDAQATISWDNPVSDFYRVMVLKDTVSISSTPTDGANYSVGDMINGSEVIYVGNASSVLVSSLMNNTQYYFKVFSQNPRKNFAAGVEVAVTPQAIVDPGVDPDPGTAGDSDLGNTEGGGIIHPFWIVALLLRIMLPGYFYRIRE